MVCAKKFLLIKYFSGLPTADCLQLVEEELPPLKEGEYLVEALYLSVDPYQRVYSSEVPLGETMVGIQIARIIDSRSVKFPVGEYILGSLGWRTHTIVNENLVSSRFIIAPYIIQYDETLPLSLYLGVLGMTGITAYFCFLDLCKPKSGETVVVTCAAGAVGHHVGQIAKIFGQKVIGITGTDEKCQWIKSLGFDHAINYKKSNLEKALSEAAPGGIDCFFDNVGGEISSTIIRKMNRHGRIAVCGSISCYNDNELPKITTIMKYIVYQELEVNGFLVTSRPEKYNGAITQNLKWIKEGKLRYGETITVGKQGDS